MDKKIAKKIAKLWCGSLLLRDIDAMSDMAKQDGISDNDEGAISREMLAIANRMLGEHGQVNSLKKAIETFN